MTTVDRRVSGWNKKAQLLCAIRTKDVNKAANLLKDGVDVDTKFTIRSQLSPAISIAVEENDFEMGKFSAI